MKTVFPILATLLFAVLLLACPAAAGTAVQDALTLCVRTVIPSLFPFFIVTGLLVQFGLDSILRPLCAPFMRPLFHLRGECAAPLLAGFLGGYPTGARSVAQLYAQGSLTQQEAEQLLGFCNNCGIGFLVGFVGAGIFQSVRIGIALLVLHILSALLAGVVLCRRNPDTPIQPQLPCHLPVQSLSHGMALTTAVSGALTATLTVCAYVVCFRTATALLPLSNRLVGAIEMVGAITTLPSDAMGFVAAAGITAWGGLSVHCQTMAVVGGLSLHKHTKGKILQTIFAVLLSIPVALWLW